MRILSMPVLIAVWTAFGLVGSAPAGAQAQSSPDQRAILTLTVNEVDKGDALVIVRGGDLLIGVETLRQAGLREFTGRRETVTGEAFVSLASLAPGIVFEFDQKALALRLTARPELLATTVLEFHTAPPPDLEYVRSPTAFLNYALNWRQGFRADASFEAGASVKGVLATSTMTWRPWQLPLRGQTSVTIDQRAVLRRWVIGDSFVGGSALGSGVLLAGFRVSREYGLDPYFVRYPSFGLSGTALTPSTVEVYVNDQLVSRQPVAPGSFDLKQLPMVVGSNIARVVVRDAFGREQDVAQSFYLAGSVLAKGLHDYDYALGFPRLNMSSTNWNYGRPVAIGQHRYGVSDSLTAGFRIEAAQGLFSGGPSVSVQLPAGDIQFSLAGSRTRTRTGGGVGLAYSYAARTFSLGAAVRSVSSGFAAVSPAGDLRRPRLEAAVYAGCQLGSRMSVTLRQDVLDVRGEARMDQTSLLASARVVSRANLLVSAGTVRIGQRRQATFSISLSLLLAGATVASLSAERTGQTTRTAVDVQRSLPVASGYGYRLRVARGIQSAAAGVIQYQGPFGRYEVGNDSLDGTRATRIGLAGSLIGIGGGLHAGRPTSDSVALIRVPEVSQVRVYADNQPVGRTNRRGELLITELLPYYANRLSIASEDIPLDHLVNDTEKTVAPPYRGGALVTFPAPAVRVGTGTAVLDVGGQTVVPAYGTLSVVEGARTIESPLGGGGEFYLENASPGSHAAVIAHGGNTCRFTLIVPESGSPFVKLGVVRCVTEARKDQ